MAPVVVTRRYPIDWPQGHVLDTPCRLWQGSVDGKGYGNINRDGRRWRLVRWIWTQVHGPIPDGLVIRHRCDVPPCYRLDHLELGTVAENNADIVDHGHAGRLPALAPSELAAIAQRKRQGETNLAIWQDYRHVGLTTIKRVRIQ